jgi:hypothetical protein
MGALLLKIQRAGKALSATTPMHPVERHEENHVRTRFVNPRAGDVHSGSIVIGDSGFDVTSLTGRT